MARKIRWAAVWVLALTAWLCVSRNSPHPSPASVIVASPIRIERTLTVEPGMESHMELSFPRSQTPGWLRGKWTVRDVAAIGQGAHDDSLVGFMITAPGGKIIMNRDHPISGNFAERYNGGTYTLTFDNAGWIRSSARIVTFEGTYQPD